MPKSERALRGTCLVLGLTAALAPLAAWSLGEFAGYFGEILSRVSPWLLTAGSLPLLAIGVGRKRALFRFGAILFPLGVFVALYADLGSSEELSGSTHIRVMTFNIMWGKFRGVRRVAEAVRAESPDIVCFQETSPHPPPHPDPAELKAGLKGYAFVWEGEMMIATRFPVLGQRSVPLPGNFDSRPLQVADLDVKGRPIRLMNVHLIYATKFGLDPTSLARLVDVRNRQIEVLMREVRESPYPVVLCGDFNVMPWHPALRPLRERLRDASRGRQARWIGTIPSQFPIRKIDYVFASPEWGSAKTYVPDANASDHEPLVADLGLR